MTRKRTYSSKDVDMLLTSKSIVETFKLSLSELSSARTQWTKEYANKLSKKIDNAIDKYLGIDKDKELRTATATILSIQQPAIRDLSFLKKQLDFDFASDRPKLKEMIKDLGFERNLRRAQNSDQEALLDLLYTFEDNLSNSLKTEIVDKGTSVKLIDRILSYAEQIKQSNAIKTTNRNVSKKVTKEAEATLDEIYKEVIAICKIASAFFYHDSLKKEQFSFNKVFHNVNASKKTKETV